MTPWQWWATRECCRADGEWQLGEFDSRAEAIAAGNDEYAPGTPFFIIEARTSTDTRYYNGSCDLIPFARTRNEERLIASADTHPKGGDVEQAPLVSGAVPKADAQGPSHD